MRQRNAMVNPDLRSRPDPAPSGIVWANDAELFALIRQELYSPVVGDILDAAGRYHQFLPAPVQPIRPDMKVVGRAMPVLLCHPTLQFSPCLAQPLAASFGSGSG